MHVMMRVKPAKPLGLFDAAPGRNVHAVVQVLVEPIINRHRRAGAEKYGRAYKMLNQEYRGDVEGDNERRVPPSKANLSPIFLIREKVIGSRAEKTVVNQSVRAKGILPARLMHEVFM